MANALLVVDEQLDFCEGGSLAVEGGTAVCEATAKYIREHGDNYDYIFFSRCHHIEPEDHFASHLGIEPDFVTHWPDHCVVGTEGHRFHPDIEALIAELNPETTFIINKGEREAAYSAFDGVVENAGTLADVLEALRVSELEVCGLALDYCVASSVIDALTVPETVDHVCVLMNLTAAISLNSTMDMTRAMLANGAVFDVTSEPE